MEEVYNYSSTMVMRIGSYYKSLPDKTGVRLCLELSLYSSRANYHLFDGVFLLLDMLWLVLKVFAGKDRLPALVDVHAAVGTDQQLAAVSEPALESAVGEPDEEDGERVQVEPDEQRVAALARLFKREIGQQIGEDGHLQACELGGVGFGEGDWPGLRSWEIKEGFPGVVGQLEAGAVVEAQSQQPVAGPVEQAVLGVLPVLDYPLPDVAAVVLLALVAEAEAADAFGRQFLRGLALGRPVCQFGLHLLVVQLHARPTSQALRGILALQQELELLLLLLRLGRRLLLPGLVLAGEGDGRLAHQAEDGNAVGDLVFGQEVVAKQLADGAAVRRARLQHPAHEGLRLFRQSAGEGQSALELGGDCVWVFEGVSSAEEEEGDDSETPGVDLVGIALLAGEYLWSHVVGRSAD
jgi:hypothetical protein